MGLFPSHCGRAFPWLKKQVAAFPKFIFGCMCLSGRRAIRIQGQPLSAASEETNENTNKAKAMGKISSPTIPHLSLVLEFLYLDWWHQLGLKIQQVSSGPQVLGAWC